MDKNEETKIQNLLKLTLEARKKTCEIEQKIEGWRDTNKAIKMANDERIRNIQSENVQLDDKLREKEQQLTTKKEKIEEQVYAIKATLLRRIFLCNLKNLMKDIPTVKVPEYALSPIYAGRFCVIYDKISEGDKPVNKYEWTVNVEITKKIMMSGLLSLVWSSHRSIHWGYGNELAQFYERDFSSEEKAKAYGERNRTRICKELIEDIKMVEDEIEKAVSNIDKVFDFRLLGSILNPNYSTSGKFKVVSAQKHELLLSPDLSFYDREVEKIQDYIITVKQQGYKLTIEGHRFSGQARDIKYAIHSYFNTEFEALEVDTKQEVRNPY